VTYTVRNPLINIGGTLCGGSIDFDVNSLGDFLTVTPSSGTLDTEGTTTVTVSLNDNAANLPEGAYDGLVSFVETFNHLGDTDRAVMLTVDSNLGTGDPNPGDPPPVDPPPVDPPPVDPPPVEPPFEIPSILAPIIEYILGDDDPPAAESP